MKTKSLFIGTALCLVLGACNNNKAERQEEIDNATALAIDSMQEVQERERVMDSIEFGASQPTLAETPAPESDRRPAPTARKKDNPVTKSDQPKETPGNTDAPSSGTVASGGSQGNTGTGDETAGTGTSGDEPAAPEENKKKGINNTVKGAIIGAGAGAVGGAIINKKNPGKGAIIGGVVGAGAGAVTGVILDKNKKKKAAKDSTATSTTTKEPDNQKSGGGEKP